jgi:hypothetical protein
MTAGMNSVESRMRGNAHVRFGRRAGETDRPKGRHRAPVRPHLANKAIDATRRWAWNLHRTLESDRAKWVKATRWALVKDPGNWMDSQRAVMARLKRDRSVLYRAWLLKEALRDLYRLDDPADAPALLGRRIASRGWSPAATVGSASAGIDANRLWLAHRAAAVNLKRPLTLGLDHNDGRWTLPPPA